MQLVSVAIAVALAACVPPSDPAYGSQQQYPQQPYPQQPPQAYPAPQPPYPQQPPAYPPPPQAPVAATAPPATGLRCAEALDACFRCNGANCTARCLQERATPRAQWLVLAVARCGQFQHCNSPQCVAQGCTKQMTACTADQSDASTPMFPEPFEGEWSTGSTSVIGFYSPTTGFTPGTSSGVSYRFTADGHFEHAAALNTQAYTCSMSSFSYSTGRYTRQGDQLVLVEQTSKQMNRNGCGGTASTISPKLESHTYTMQFAPSEIYGDTELTLLENGKPVFNPFQHK